MLNPWFAITFHAARLGFEAQNAAAFVSCAWLPLARGCRERAQASGSIVLLRTRRERPRRCQERLAIRFLRKTGNREWFHTVAERGITKTGAKQRCVS